MISRLRLPSRGWKQPLVKVARAGLISIPRCGRRRTVDTTPDAYTLSFHCSPRSNHSSQSYLWSWRCSNVTLKLRDSTCDLFGLSDIFSRVVFVESGDETIFNRKRDKTNSRMNQDQEVPATTTDLARLVRWEIWKCHYFIISQNLETNSYKYFWDTRSLSLHRDILKLGNTIIHNSKNKTLLVECKSNGN